MQPISSKNRNLYRGPSGSTEFNSIRNSMHHDIYALFELANSHESTIREHMDILIRENFFLQNRLSVLESSLESIKENLIYKQNGEMKHKDIRSFYSLENIIEMDNESHRAKVDTTYGVASFNDSEKASKVSYRGTNDKVSIPSSLEVTIYESNDTRPMDESTGLRENYIVQDVNLEHVFDQNKNTFWLRTVSFAEDKAVSEVTGILHIKLPVDILTDINVNTLTINPYPEYSMEITDIHYKSYGDQWNRLPNYPTTTNNNGDTMPVSIKDAPKLLFTFPKEEISEIQIYFKQPYWFKNEGNRDFVYGFQDISIENRSYKSEQVEFVTEFSLEGTTKGFQRISDPIIVPAVGSEQNIEDLVEHKLYYDRKLTNEFAFGSEIMAPIQKVYVKTILRKQGDIIPVIKQIQLDYVYKDIS